MGGDPHRPNMRIDCERRTESGTKGAGGQEARDIVEEFRTRANALLILGGNNGLSAGLAKKGLALTNGVGPLRRLLQL